MTETPINDPELELARRYGDQQGALDGQRTAMEQIRTQAYLNAFHAEMQAAGLCDCPDAAPTPASVDYIPAHPSVDLKSLADQLSGFVVELSRIASTLQPKLAPRGGQVEPMLRDSEPNELAAANAAERRVTIADIRAGGQVDADDTPAVPAQHTLDIDPPFVACKAPSGLIPGRFCSRPIGHQGPCRYVDADKLPLADADGLLSQSQ